MHRATRHLRQLWARSRAFRIILIVALIYTVLRLAVHGAYLATMLYPNAGILGGAPEWTGSKQDPMVPVDLQVYLDAAERLLERENLYLQGPITYLEDLYQYTPAFALAFVPFLRMSPLSVSVLHTVLHIAAYAWLYLAWDRIFHDLDLPQARKNLAQTVPVWLVFSAFWSDLGYLNIYVLMALLSTLLTGAILSEKLGWSVLWLSLILQTKPQWAFAAAVPLLAGKRRFFLSLVASSLLAYGAVVALTMMATSPTYGLQQYARYFRFLSTLPVRFPWRGPDAPYLGYNHSVKQTVIYLVGQSPGALRLATAIKLLLLAPLAIVTGRYLMRALRGYQVKLSLRGIDFAFALYLGAFIWLDVVWELSLTIAIFGYLLATLEGERMKSLVWAAFIPYALIDLWQLVSFAVFGMDVVAPGPYILTDPSIYIPMIMIVLLTFYALLIGRVWEATPAYPAVGPKARQ
jgi:hypothetical protein